MPGFLFNFTHLLRTTKGANMAISLTDMNELKRIATNARDEEKACFNRIIRGISELNTKVQFLLKDKDRLEKELTEAKNTK
jgi:hypothetical protein